MITTRVLTGTPGVRAESVLKLLTGVVASVLVAVSPASAGDPDPTEWMDLDSGPLGADEFFEGDFVVSDSDAGGLGVAGFEVRFDYSEPIADRSWASDVQVMVVAPTGEDHIVGGLTRLADADVFWSFQGESSDPPGRYGDSGDDVFLPWASAPRDLGVYSVRFTNDWTTDPNANLYESVQVRFYFATLPAPGALAVLGLAALARRRRRR